MITEENDKILWLFNKVNLQNDKYENLNLQNDKCISDIKFELVKW